MNVRGRRIRKVNITDVLKTLFLADVYRELYGVFRTESDLWIVDTCRCADTGLWETGILRPKDTGRWVVVEQYETKQEAEQGHNKWVRLMREDPERELIDIELCFLEE